MDEVHLIQNPEMQPINVEETPEQVTRNINIRLAYAAGLSEEEVLNTYIESLPDIVATDKGDIRLMFVVS